jgi:hypothetical protein
MATGPIERAVRRDLRRAGDDVRTSALALSALQLARRLDGRDTCESCSEDHPVLTARDEATITRELRLSLQSLLGGGGDDDGYAAIIAGLSAPVGDPA